MSDAGFEATTKGFWPLGHEACQLL